LRFLLFAALRLCVTTEWFVGLAKPFNLGCAQPTLMAQGHAVALLPVHADLTTQPAADVLSVSRPHLIGLLEDGNIPFRRVGQHRGIRTDDLLAYHRKDDEQPRRVADVLTADAQELGMGYRSTFVLAAAIHSGAGLIVTFNLVDFPLQFLAPLGTAARHPDGIFLELLDSAVDKFFAAAQTQRQALKQPTLTVEQFRAKLAVVGFPQTAGRLSKYADWL
jgi:excisionase family DNA binding protein